jgi:hypothetical protein
MQAALEALERRKRMLARLKSDPGFLAQVMSIKPHPFHPDMAPHEVQQAHIRAHKKKVALEGARKRAATARKRSSSGRRRSPSMKRKRTRSRSRGKGRGRGTGTRGARGNRAGRGRGRTRKGGRRRR